MQTSSYREASPFNASDPSQSQFSGRNGSIEFNRRHSNQFNMPKHSSMNKAILRMTMPNKKQNDPIQKQKTLFQRQTTISSYGKFNNRLQSALKTSVSKSFAGEQFNEIDEASKQQAAKDKLEHKRIRQIALAFESLDKAVEEDVKSLHAIEAKYELQLQQDGHDHHNYQGALAEIQKLRFVRLLKDFEESSEYENMYNQIDQETKAANYQIQNLVAQTFGNVKFQNDGPSLTLEKKKQLDDLSEAEQSRRRTARTSLNEEHIIVKVSIFSRICILQINLLTKTTLYI